ncbi:DMT family transporter [Paracoccaceae bacterium]|nr:DMT family transporter [Paracoccaceae bacterium]
MEKSRPLLALAYMMGATASFTAMAVAGRELSGELSTFEIMTYRSAIGLVIVVGIAWARGLLPDIKARRMGLHVIRNIAHFSGQNLWFFAVGLIPFSQLFAFEFSFPLWVALFAPIFLSERLTGTRIAAAIIGFIGILIVARPDQMELGSGVIAAFFCAIGFAGASIGTKLLTRTETTVSILFWLTALQLIFGLIITLYDGEIKLPDTVNGPWVFLVALCGLSAHFCITTAMTFAPATVVAPLDFARLPFIAVIGMVFYDEPLIALTFVGALIIFGANYLNIRAEHKRGA